MIFSVIPFLHSLGTEGLLYFAGSIDPKDITVGSTVEIPYGNNYEYGIISQTYNSLPENISEEQYNRIKNCKNIITSQPILAKYQIKMIESLSRRYMIPIHRVLGMFLSKPIWNRLEKKEFKALEQYTENETKHVPDGEIHIFQENIVKPEDITPFLEDKTIVIVPDDFALIPYEKQFSDQANIFFYKNDLTDTRKAQAWIDIYNGKYSIIYGTRKILYYNLSAYKNIIYIEDSLGADYWHYPIRIRYIDILQIFAKWKKDTKVTILTSIPTLSTLHHFRHFQIKNISKD